MEFQRRGMIFGGLVKVNAIIFWFTRDLFSVSGFSMEFLQEIELYYET